MESHFAIECDRILHCRFNGIETHALIADDARFLDYAFHQNPAQAHTAIGRPHVKPLHLADTGFEFAQRNASGGVACVSCKQQSPARRAVGARKGFQLLIETLEAQAEAERTAIFKEEAASLFDVFGERGLNQFVAPIALTRMVLTWIVPTPTIPNKIAFAVSRGRHWRDLQLYSEAPTDFTPPFSRLRPAHRAINILPLPCLKLFQPIPLARTPLPLPLPKPPSRYSPFTASSPRFRPMPWPNIRVPPSR